MANMLFNRQQNKPSNSSPFEQIKQIQKQGPSNVLFNNMYNNNPQFKQFADSVRNMSPEQAFQQYGLDFNQFKEFRW